MYLQEQAHFLQDRTWPLSLTQLLLQNTLIYLISWANGVKICRRKLTILIVKKLTKLAFNSLQVGLNERSQLCKRPDLRICYYFLCLIDCPWNEQDHWSERLYIRIKPKNPGFRKSAHGKTRIFSLTRTSLIKYMLNIYFSNAMLV